MNLNTAQLKNKEYNLEQTAVGHPLRTLKGSAIKRSKFGVGKLIGGQLYFQRDYSTIILDEGDIATIDNMSKVCPFDYAAIRYDMKNGQIALVEAPDFDTAREPVVGRMFIVESNGSTTLSRFYNQVWHHKWLFVDNSYSGFNVAESWEWSREWLSVLTEPADGSNLQNWKSQLARFGLK